MRSRVDINTDLPVRSADLATRSAHETFPATTSNRLGGGRPRRRPRPPRASILLINTPECLITRGSPTRLRVRLTDRRGGRPAPSSCYDRPACVAADPAAARDARNERSGCAPRGRLAEVRVNARLIATPTAPRTTRPSPTSSRSGAWRRTSWKAPRIHRASLWRTYFSSTTRARAPSTLLDVVPKAERPARFGLLLHGTHSTAIAAELRAITHDVIEGPGARTLDPRCAGAGGASARRQGAARRGELLLVSDDRAPGTPRVRPSIVIAKPLIAPARMRFRRPRTAH